MLTIEHLTKQFGEKTLFRDLCLTVDGPAVLWAPSGWGKTTLLRILMGLETPTAGRGQGAGRVSAVFQEDRLCGNLTVGGNLRMVCGNSKKGSELLALLTSLGIGETLDIPASQLSGGMARRVALARALLTDPELLILDEPFTGLDDAARQKSAAAIGESCPRATVLLVTHRKEDAALIGAARILEL